MLIDNFLKSFENFFSRRCILWIIFHLEDNCQLSIYLHGFAVTLNKILNKAVIVFEPQLFLLGSLDRDKIERAPYDWKRAQH